MSHCVGPGGGEYPLLYLESADSVQSRIRLPEDGVKEPSSLQHTQTTQLAIEVLFALAFGYDLVTSQSYAFDSFAYQTVLRYMSKAYHQAFRNGGVPDHRPMRVHFFGSFERELHSNPQDQHAITTSREAAESMFLKMGRATPDAFYSSLYPDMVGDPGALEVAKRIREGQANPLHSLGVSAWRADLLDSTLVSRV